MQVILTGSTGFAGSAILRRLLADDSVDRVTSLSRRATGVSSGKLDEVLLSDFSAYDAGLIARLAEHDACIWALGGKASDLAQPDLYERITHTFTLSLAREIASAAARRPFSFCYLSGMGADPTETARLPWQKLTRHLKGRTERDLSALQSAHPQFCVHHVRPGGILPADTSRALATLLAPIAVPVDDLAKAMVACCDPTLFGRLPLVTNAQIRRLAKG